jgi:emfourin
MAPPPDRIEVVRHGGFAGIERRGALDVTTCSDDEREAALAALDDLRRAAAAPPEPPRPDAFIYTVAVTEGDRHEELTLAEHAVGDAVRPFLDRVLRGG